VLPNTATDAPPDVSAFAIKPKKFAPKGKSKSGRPRASAKGPKKGAKFTYTLSEASKVSIVVERKKRGKFTKATTLSAQKQSGKQSTPFSGKAKGKPLAPGSYRATITATDNAGQKSQPRQVTFKIVSG
jgi:hypothetical protein